MAANEVGAISDFEGIPIYQYHKRRLSVKGLWRAPLKQPLPLETCSTGPRQDDSITLNKSEDEEEPSLV